MNMIYRRIAASALFAAALICTLMSAPAHRAIAAYDDTRPYNWYVVRTKDHTQPSADPNMTFVEKLGGYYIDKRHTGLDEGEEKVVYLTFDAGYENGNVARILDTMKGRGVTGAFFILGNMTERFPDLVMRMKNEGHLVCNHTYTHNDMSTVGTEEEFAAELSRMSDTYRELTGCEMAKYYRPPQGRFSERSMRFADALGYKTVFWSFAYADWDNNNQPSHAEAMKKITDNIHNGAVILLHPTSKTNADIMGELIDRLRAEGYRFGTLDELCAEQ